MCCFWEQCRIDAAERDRFIPADDKSRINDDVVEPYFEEQSKELAKRDIRGAHEIAGNEHKAVDADLTPHAEKIQKIRVPGIGRFGDDLGNTGIHHIVVCYNQKHRYDAKQFDIRISFLTASIVVKIIPKAENSLVW